MGIFIGMVENINFLCNLFSDFAFSIKIIPLKRDKKQIKKKK